MRNPRNDSAALDSRSPGKAGAQSERNSSGLLALQENSHGPERTCVLTRRRGTRDTLIRLALSPEGVVAPDVRARAPGRGAWIGVTCAQLDSANARGKLKAALQRAYKTNEVSVPAELGAMTAASLRQAALDRLGMEARARNLVSGAERLEAACRKGEVHLLLHAADAGEDGCKRLDQAWRVGGAVGLGFDRGLVIPAERAILSMALGRENVVHVALTDRAAAARVLHALARWRAFIEPGAGLEGRDPAPGSGSAEELSEGTE